MSNLRLHSRHAILARSMRLDSSTTVGDVGVLSSREVCRDLGACSLLLASESLLLDASFSNALDDFSGDLSNKRETKRGEKTGPTGKFKQQQQQQDQRLLLSLSLLSPLILEAFF